MSASTRSDFVDLTYPLRERLKLYDPTKPPHEQSTNDAADPARAIPRGFIDAMDIRETVFVKEQGVPLENELDDDDPRSFHWTAYASIPVKASDIPSKGQSGDARRSSTSTKMPIGTIRLVLPPHPPHPNGKTHTDVHKDNETYVKLGRLAVIKEFRKAGIAKLLIETALAFARDHPTTCYLRWMHLAWNSYSRKALAWTFVDSSVFMRRLVCKRCGGSMDSRPMKAWDHGTRKASIMLECGRELMSRILGGRVRRL